MDVTVDSRGNDTTQDTIRVILVDDHETVRHGVRRFLSSDAGIQVVGEAESSCGAISLVTRLRPEVVILDIRLRQGNGIEVSRAIRNMAQNTRVLVFTAYDDNQYIVSLVKLGVSGYLTKTSSAEDLIRAVHYAAKGWLVFSPEVADRVANLLRENGDRSFDEAEGDVGGAQELAKVQRCNESLTAREMEVLQHIFHGLRNGDIADAMGISPKTVEIHIHRILLKLGAKNRSQAVVNSLGLGYLQDVAVPAGLREGTGGLSPLSHNWGVLQEGIGGIS